MAVKKIEDKHMKMRGWILMTRVCFLRHDCSVANMLQLSMGITPVEKCPFYFKLFNAHCFTLFGFRMIVGKFR